MTALELLGWQGKVRRGVYALVGCVGLAIKHNLDRFIALSFGERWSVWSYWAPIERLSGLQALSANDKKFLLTLFVTAVPFIWIGLTLTAKRLRDAGQPTWLATLFFAPVINLIFFAVLAVYPSAGEPANPANAAAAHASPFWPRSKWGSAALAVAISTIIGVLGAWAAISGLGSYGLSLFLALPFVMGYVSVWAHTCPPSVLRGRAGRRFSKCVSCRGGHPRHRDRRSYLHCDGGSDCVALGFARRIAGLCDSH